MYQKGSFRRAKFLRQMEKIKLLTVADGVSLIRQDLVWLEEQLQHEK